MLSSIKLEWYRLLNSHMLDKKAIQNWEIRWTLRATNGHFFTNIDHKQ
jgi:hypothetical protein